MKGRNEEELVHFLPPKATGQAKNNVSQTTFVLLAVAQKQSYLR